MIVKNYTKFFENIQQATSIKEYEKIFDTKVKFKDPFHEVEGIDKLYHIFQEMYNKLDDPKFTVIETIQKNNVVYLKWIFTFYFKKKQQKNSFEGVSRVEFDANGKAISHVDYWDSAENLYEKIPIVSFFIKYLKCKIAS